MTNFHLRLAAAIFCSATAMAAQTLPAGTALPIMLNSTLKAKSAKPGQKIEGKLMQEVPLADGGVIKKGSRVSGQVVSVQPPSRITVRFDQMQDEHQQMALNVGLRALAASNAVFQAGVPIDASSTYEGSNSWTTKQVGGDVVNRGRGLVGSDTGIVGRWTGTGVWGKLTPTDECPASGTSVQEQALWVFSTTACGAYGYENELKIAHPGRTEPVGQITLQSSKALEISGGSGWLLVVNSTPSGAKP
jgi:hypothetical protein